MLDGTGALRGFGGAADLAIAPAVSQPVAAAVGDDGRGYVLERTGGLVPVGGLPGTEVSPPGGAGAVDLAASGPGRGWVLDDRGRLLGFGGEADPGATPVAGAVAVTALPTAPGGWVLDRSGQLWPFGGARLVLPVSTDARAGAAVDVATLGLVTGTEFLGSSDARYIDGLHRLFAGRGATDVEAHLGVTALEQGVDRIDLTHPLARSEWWAGASLDRIYLDVLGRDPDAAGRAYWLGQIAGGLALEDLGTYFYGSREFALAAGSEEAYVRRLYQLLLHREPDQEGLGYWTGQLTSGRAQPTDIAAGFYASIESRRDRATRLHQQILGADPSASRRDSLADRLGAVGDVGLAAELAASSEFYRRATS